MKLKEPTVRRFNNIEIAVLAIYSIAIIFCVLVPIAYGWKLAESLMLNAILLYGACFFHTLLAEKDKPLNERPIDNILSPFTAIVGATLFIAANVIASL